MKILLLTENFLTLDYATAKIVKKITDFDKNIHYTVVCKGNTKKHFVSNNTDVYQMPSYYNFGYKNLNTFLYKLLVKITKRFFPKTLLDKKRFDKIAKKIIKKSRFDKIISISGWFSTHASAIKLSKKFNIPVFLVYTDPFIGNLDLTNFNEKRLKKIEKPWLLNAESIFMPQNYIEKYQNIYEKEIISKIINFELPCIVQDAKTNEVGNHLIYTGALSNRIKNYSVFDLFLDKLDICLKCFGEKPKNAKFQNISFHERVSPEVLHEHVKKAKALLIIDNYFGIQIPSKAIEAISSNKKIIFIYYREDSACYKFYKQYDDILFISFDHINRLETIENTKNYLNLNININREIYTDESQIKKIIEKL